MMPPVSPLNVPAPETMSVPCIEIIMGLLVLRK